eukprot:4823443-Pleurochrysis_carterae.AAC.2
MKTVAMTSNYLVTYNTRLPKVLVELNKVQSRRAAGWRCVRGRVQFSSRRCMDAAAPNSRSPPPAASAKRSLRTAIDGKPERPDAGRVRGSNDSDLGRDRSSPTSFCCADIGSSR